MNRSVFEDDALCPAASGRPPVYYERSVPSGECRGGLVLLHGLASNATRWAELAARTSLREEWIVLRPDLRGHGHSLDPGPLGLDRWADDVAALLDRERLVSAIVAGHCLGASIAQRFAVRHPARVRGLVLIEPLYPEALRPALRRLQRLSGPVRGVIATLRLAHRFGLHRRRYHRPDMQRLDRETRAALAEGGAAGVMRRRYGSPWHDLRNLPLAAYLESLLATIEEPLAAGLDHPALALLSSGSMLADPGITSARLSRQRQCRVVVLAADHWLPTERPDELRGAIEAWVEALPARGPGLRRPAVGGGS